MSPFAAGARISSWRDSWVMFFHECGAVRVADDRDEGNARVERFDEPRREVGRAGAEGRVADPGAAGDPGEGVGRERAAPLVVDEGVAEPELADRVVEGEELEPPHSRTSVRIRGYAASPRGRGPRSCGGSGRSRSRSSVPASQLRALLGRKSLLAVVRPLLSRGGPRTPGPSCRREPRGMPRARSPPR